MCTVASAPSPNQLLVSLALTRSEISSRSPAAARLEASTVTWPGALPVSGKVLPLSCNSITRLSSVNGTSIGTPSFTLPWSVAATRSSRAGNGQSGLVALGTMRVSACTPSVRITQSARIFGCAANARVGLTSSHRFGAPAEA